MQDEITVSGEAAVINDVSTTIGEWAERKGFRDDWKDADIIEHIATYLDGKDVGNTIFVSRYQGEGVDDVQTTVVEELRRIANVLRTNVLGTKLMLQVTELAEAMETLRDHGAEGIMAGRGNFGEEQADAVIRIGDTMHMVLKPLGDHVMTKVEANNHREHKHGRKL